VFAAFKRFVKLLFLAAVALGFVVFSVDNRQAITISFFPLPYSAEMPVFLFAIACFIPGALTAGVITSSGLYQVKRQHKFAQRRVAALENETRTLQVQQETKLPVVATKK